MLRIKCQKHTAYLMKVTGYKNKKEIKTIKKNKDVSGYFITY